MYTLGYTRIHQSLFPQTTSRLVRVKVKLNHWIIEPKSHLGVERMYDDILVPRPQFKSMTAMGGHESIGFDASAPWVIASNDEIACHGAPSVCFVREPDLVAW